MTASARPATRSTASGSSPTSESASSWRLRRTTVPSRTAWAVSGCVPTSYGVPGPSSPPGRATTSPVRPEHADQVDAGEVEPSGRARRRPRRPARRPGCRPRSGPGQAVPGGDLGQVAGQLLDRRPGPRAGRRGRGTGAGASPKVSSTTELSGWKPSTLGTRASRSSGPRGADGVHVGHGPTPRRRGPRSAGRGGRPVDDRPAGAAVDGTRRPVGGGGRQWLACAPTRRSCTSTSTRSSPPWSSATSRRCAASRSWSAVSAGAGVVATASYEARVFGVRSAMSDPRGPGPLPARGVPHRPLRRLPRDQPPR